MSKKRINYEELEEKILEIIDYERGFLSISQVTKILKEKFGISVSPQIVKRYLLKLKEDKKIN